MHGWRDHELLRRALDVFGLARSQKRRTRRRRSSSLPSSGRRPAPPGTSTRPTGCAPRSKRRAGKRATSRTASSSSRDDTRAGLRPAPGAGGAARPARSARALGDGARGEDGALAAGRRASAPAGEAGARAQRSSGHPRPPGRARVVRAVQVRRRVGARSRRAAAARVPRPGDRSAQPRRRHPQRRRSGRDRESSSRRTAPRP